jgi:sirohydrochlorin ferrochelatase
MNHHLLIAHGSPDLRHRETMQSLAKAVDARGLSCDVAFLEHDAPSVETWLSRQPRGTSVVTLGMLLAPGYHATVDVPRLLATAPDGVTVHDRGPLAAGPWLFDILTWLVSDVAASERTPVVLATAGSTRPEARQALDALASGWGQTRGGEVVLAAGTGPGLSLEDAVQAVAPDAVVLPLMIAQGVLADRATAVAQRHGLRTTGTLAHAPQLPDVLVERLSG